MIIDPLTSFLGNKHNMNTAQSIGNLLRELSRVAYVTGAAIVAVCHLTKSTYGKEIDRHLGSSDIINAARSVLSATRVNEDSDVIIVKHLKSTLAKRAQPLYYEIVGNGVIEFKDAIETDDDDFSFLPKKETKVSQAENVLLDLLSEGAMSQAAIKEEFEKLDICKWRTVEEAKKRLNIVQFWDNDVSYWKLEG